tara:strand:+ start:1258 stop:2973 length:1716 start_codon:yes stop_codon:yes gene_type:complete
MALENLKDIFEQAGFGGGAPISDPTPAEEQTPDLNKIEQLYKPDSKLASKITFGNPTTTDYELGTGIFNNPNVYDGDKIKERTFDTTKIGQDNNLGQGDFVFETLYNVDHTPNLNRVVIKHGQTSINTGRAGAGDLSKLDIFSYSSPERGVEPYFISEVGTSEGPADQRSRILKFYKSPAGTNAILKENATNFLYAPNKFSVGNVIFPALPAVSDATTKLAGMGLGIGQADAFINDLGPTVASLRNILRIEYSKRPTYGLPFKNLGDAYSNKPTIQTDVVSELANDYGLTRQKNIELPFKNNEGENKELKFGDKLRDGVKSFANKIKIPIRKFRKTPFIDLSGKGNHNDKFELGEKKIRLHGYDDKIAETTIETTTDFLYGGETTNPLEDETFNINPGDFYVRIKDLRDDAFIYFRGFVTGITENVSPSYTPTNYIGRSEPVYIYERAERDISFNLRVYPNNIEQFNAMYIKIDRLTSLAYPEYMNDGEGLNRMKAPFTELYMAHIGSKTKGQFGYIKSISYTVVEQGDWDANQALPRLFDIALSYQILSKRPPSLKYGSNGTGLFYGGRS